MDGDISVASRAWRRGGVFGDLAIGRRNAAGDGSTSVGVGGRVVCRDNRHTGYLSPCPWRRIRSYCKRCWEQAGFLAVAVAGKEELLQESDRGADMIFADLGLAADRGISAGSRTSAAFEPMRFADYCRVRRLGGRRGCSRSCCSRCELYWASPLQPSRF